MYYDRSLDVTLGDFYIFVDCFGCIHLSHFIEAFLDAHGVDIVYFLNIFRSSNGNVTISDAICIYCWWSFIHYQINKHLHTSAIRIVTLSGFYTNTEAALFKRLKLLNVSVVSRARINMKY